MIYWKYENILLERNTETILNTTQPIINEKLSCDRLEVLRTKALKKENIEYLLSKLIHVISDKNTLILAYENIKSNPGNSTKGTTTETLDGINLKWFENIEKELKSGKFEFGPIRRTYIPKPGDNKTKRSLGLAPPRDKIVQKSIQMVLEAIYEPIFLDTSHGSRPQKGNHTALRYVKEKFSGVNWVIEGDISKCFDKINHKKLLKFISKRISCTKTIKLIEKSLRVKYKERNNFITNNIGTPQGSVISPLLNNIYLHELDTEIENLKTKYETKGRRKKDNIVRNARRRELYSAKKEERKPELAPNIPNYINDEKHVKIKYVRYVDDFLIGIEGHYKWAETFKHEVKEFLSKTLFLELNDQKTKITKFSDNKVFYLGTFIRGTFRKEKPVKTIIRKGKKIRTRITPRVTFHAPIKRLFDKAATAGFFHKEKESMIPRSYGAITQLDHADILKFYNSKIEGILNYYSFVDNKKSLGSIIHGLKASCALTLALKYKLRTQRKSFKKFGSKLTCPITKVGLKIPTTFKRTSKFSIGTHIPESKIMERWNNKLTISNINKKCIICGNSTNIEMHHVRAIKDLKTLYSKSKIDWFTLQMRELNRKQVPLCREHHQKVHNNSLNSDEKKLFMERTKKK